MDIIGNIASILGFIISIIALIIVIFVEKKVNKLQYSNLFDKRINSHLSNIDLFQKELNLCLPDVLTNEVKTKEVLVKLLAEFESLSPKLQDKIARKKTDQLIYKINYVKEKDFFFHEKSEDNFLDKIMLFCKSFFLNKISNRKILKIYVLVNENYNRIQQIKHDKKNLIK